jgi:hypothetical protein
MPGEPPRVQPSKKVAAHWDQEGNRLDDRADSRADTGRPERRDA